jgi:hypothetical protein
MRSQRFETRLLDFMKSSQIGVSSMKRITSVAAVVFASSCVAMQAAPAFAQDSSGLRNPQIEIVYVPPSNRSYQAIYDRLRNRQVLEMLQQFLAPVKLPRQLIVKTEQCGASTRPYKPQGPVTICYELVSQIERVAAGTKEDSRQTVTTGAFIQAVLHEVAHAMFDMLNVPVWGRMGDAADRLAALVMLSFGEDLALQTISGTTTFFEASKRTWTGSDFADVTSPEEQRYYNYLCIAYGGAPISFKFLVSDDERPILPKKRAVRCAKEYQQVRKAFNLRIMQFVDADLLVKVRSMEWLLPRDVK